MNYRVLGAILLLAACASSAASARQTDGNSSPQTASLSVYDTASFAAELRRISGILDEKLPASEAAALRKSLPQDWNVQTSGQSYSISTQPLRSYLDSAAMDKAGQWVKHLEAQLPQARVAGRMNETSSAGARKELDRILAQSEFRAARPPSALDLLKERVSAWLDRMLLKFFSGLAGHPLGVEIFFWMLLICAVGFVAMLVLRLFRRGKDFEVLKPASAIVNAWTWQEWVRNARQAADRGDFRQAIHSLYWAGIAHLEDLEMLPRDRSKTPREYLRLAKESRSANGCMEEKFLDPLTRLTTRLERIWYADHEAGRDDFRDSMAQLEALGCHSD